MKNFLLSFHKFIETGQGERSCIERVLQSSAFLAQITPFITLTAVLYGDSGPEKSRNNTREETSYFFTCVDIANQLLIRHSPLAPLGQVDE